MPDDLTPSRRLTAARLGRPAACQSPLSTKLVCDDCNGFYGSKVWGSNTKYRRTIWRCNENIEGIPSAIPSRYRREVKLKFIQAFNSILEYREGINCHLAQESICDYTDIDVELDALRREMEVVAELSRKAIYENIHTVINQRNGMSGTMATSSASHGFERVIELEEQKRSGNAKALCLMALFKIWRRVGKHLRHSMNGYGWRQLIRSRFSQTGNWFSVQGWHKIIR